MTPASTRTRALDAALAAFSSRGYEATSLDALAAELGVAKQTILYYFSSKESLLQAVIDRVGEELVETLEQALAQPGWRDPLDEVVRSVFRLAGRRPELLGLLREATRLGPPASTWLAARLEPFIARATRLLDARMADGRVRRTDARLVLLAGYSAVIGVATEVEVLRALGVDATARSLVRRRGELLGFLHSALDAPGASGTGGFAYRS